MRRNDCDSWWSRWFDDGAVALLGGLGGRAEDGADLLPRRAGGTCGHDGLHDLLFAARPSQRSTLQEVLLDRAFVALARLVDGPKQSMS